MRLRRALPWLAVLACGPAGRDHPSLPSAGSLDDDGAGLLARWSRGQATPPARTCFDADCDEDGDAYLQFGGAEAAGDGVEPSELAADTAPPPVEGYTIVEPVSLAGAVTGTVRWRRSPAEAAAAPGCPHASAPAAARSAPALVYLADIRSGKAPAALGGVLELQGCRLWPELQLAAPIGAPLTVANLDREPSRIRWTRGQVQDGPSSLLPGKHELHISLMAAGTYEFVGDPGGSAWVVVPPHPYYTITQGNGAFMLAEVPAGRYVLVVWRPAGSGPPVEVREPVVITAHSTLRHDVEVK